MFSMRSKMFRFIAPAVVLVAIMGTAAAFTNTNTVPVSGAGEGAGVISGYTASAVTYIEDSTTPSNLSGMSFTLTPTSGGPDATSVAIELTTGGVWYKAPVCSISGTAATCTFTTEPTVASVTNLDIVATGPTT